MSVELIVKFDTGNAYFDEDRETKIQEVLQVVVNKVSVATGKYQNILDENGNIIGTYRFKDTG